MYACSLCMRVCNFSRPQANESNIRKGPTFRRKEIWKRHGHKKTNVQVLEPGSRVKANSIITMILTTTVTTNITKNWLCVKQHARYFTYIPFNPFYRWEIWDSKRWSHLPMVMWPVSKEIRIQTLNPRFTTSGFTMGDAHQNHQGRHHI